MTLSRACRPVFGTFACLVAVASCAPAGPPARQAGAPQGWNAVLVAGDGSIPVFDNATGQVSTLLEASGTKPSAIHRFSDAPDVLALPRVQLASKSRVLNAIATLNPRPGQACLVFMTSHGAQGEGLFLAAHDEFLTPNELDDALTQGCGSAPTVAILSACYSGAFAQPPVARPNRIVLTAAAADRPSFGCGAGAQLAFYDECLLRTLVSMPGSWAAVTAKIDGCVTALESQGHQRPSMPRTAIGAAAAATPVPGQG